MRLAVAATSLLALGATAKPTSAKGEAASIREYFYAGGSYADDGKGGHIFKDQAYVEHLTPVSGATKRYPIVFIHGQAQTGTVSFPYSLQRPWTTFHMSLLLVLHDRIRA